MSYPQPKSVDSVLSSQDYWRLTTELVSSGDIYESEVGGLAFALGPQSDLANIQVTYFDPSASNPAGGGSPMVSQFTLTPERIFVGRVDAWREFYPKSTRRGRILITPGDTYRLYNPIAMGAGDKTRVIVPTLDVIQYFKEVPSASPTRSDKSYYFEYHAVPAAPADDTFIVFPSYGRKSGYFTFLNRTAVPITPMVYGVSLSLSRSTGGPGVNGSFERELFSNGGVALAANAATNWAFKAGTNGLWDLMFVRLDGYAGGSMPVTITLSDNAL